MGQQEQEDGGEGDSDDGAVSFLQYEAATGDNAVLKPEGLSLLLERFASKLSAQDDEEGEDLDVCDSAVQEQLFNAADADGSGKVSAQELVDAFDMPQEEADGFVAATDSNGDGEVSLEELQAFFAEVVCHDKATMKLKAHDDGHGTGGAMKKKKQKADEKREAAEKRKDDAEKRKDAEEHGDDGAVSFLQEDEDDAEDDAVLADADSEHGGNGKKKLKKKIKVLEIKKEARRRKVANAAHKSNAKKKIKKKIKADDK